GDYTSDLSRLVLELKKEITQCKECFRFFLPENTAGKECDICQNTGRDPGLLMVVEKDSDLESVEKSHVYHGRYFVLGGLVPIVEKTTKNRVRVEELKKKLSGNGKIKEIILAFSLSPQGDHTDSYIREQIKESTEKSDIKMSSLGRGLSTGTELEYSDNDTLKNALKNRQ
ncbi:MAG: toprim domain-containing protein, partial [Candidatus Paceibacterota bacterium]